MDANRMDYKGGMTTMPSASVENRKTPGFSAAAIPEDYIPGATFGVSKVQRLQAAERDLMRG